LEFTQIAAIMFLQQMYVTLPEGDAVAENMSVLSDGEFSKYSF